ncbi:MAG: MBL fold metallo-hydrolase [Acidimicrobiia bacterium]|nr:MAG: MBL fold metallo-hydrolase [Acidimicrobiia bacterium]
MRIERILAPNPSIYTGPGTNTYLIEHAGEALILDPGPVIESHRQAIHLALSGHTPVGVVATHTHPDHAPLSNPLAVELDVPVFGFATGPEFRPDVFLADADTVPVGDSGIVAVHTPGHTADHLCFTVDDLLFTGDHIMEGSTVIMEDAAAYLDSLYAVRELGVERIEPGHGAPLDDAGTVIETYIEHRLLRERQIVDAVAAGAATIDDVVDAVYAAIPEMLRPAAAHQVRVQVDKLVGDGLVAIVDGGLTLPS